MNDIARKSILFVDDEERLLQGLQRMLRPMRGLWDMEFLTSGTEAIRRLGERCFDVIVSDMKMPEVDGATLLHEARNICPSCIRMVLSGQAEPTSVLRATQVAHQYMSKPCDVEGLKTRIRNACAIRDLVGCSNVKTALSGLLQIPTIPQYYDCLLEELQSTSPSMALLEGLVLNDPGLTAKVLQISNSAFFGPSKSICNPIEALRNIGVEGLRGLTMNAKVISRCELSENVLSLPALVAHCHGVTDILERIFTIEPFSEEEKCQARTAGILHEIGRILLATLLPDLYAEVRNLIDKQGFTQEHAEYTVFGVTHPEIGAYLLALWGLPKPIVDAVAFHHNPEQSDQNTFNVLSALHVANVLEDELRPRSRFESKLELDTNYMGRIGKERSVTVWMSKCGLNS